MPAIGDKKPCTRAGCTGEMTWQRISRNAHFTEGEGAIPESMRPYEAWVCDVSENHEDRDDGSVRP
jgi:hypothetical protein